MHKRMSILLVSLIFSLSVLLCYIYFLTDGFLKRESPAFSNEQNAKVIIEGKRGQFYDRNGLPFLYETSTYLTIVEPQYFSMGDVPALSELLSISWDEVSNGIRNKKPFAVYSENKITKAGITQFDYSLRYESAQSALHLIGYLKDGEGVTGSERVFDDFLSSSENKTVLYSSDVLGQSISGSDFKIETENLKKGIYLTIDKALQEILEEGADKFLDVGGAVVLDIKTGEIVASVSRPNFDPNNIAGYLESDGGEFLNRAFLSYPMGSVFKTATLLLAIEKGIDPETTMFICDGSIDVSDHNFSCLKKDGHGEISLKDAFALSCNPAFIELMQMVGGWDEVYSLASALKLGEGADLSFGLKTPDGYLPEGNKIFNLADEANLSLGQGDLLVSPLSVARMMAAVARGGIDIPPTLFLKGVDEEGRTVLEGEAGRMSRIFPSGTAESVKNLLRYAVTNGTGRPADTASGVAGKTGSAEAGEKTHGWFAGFFPYDNPRYAMAVIAEDGKTGGGGAAPLFKFFAEHFDKNGELAEQVIDNDD